MDAKGKKILIADDEPDILELLQYNLVREGYEVTTAKDGEDALLKAKNSHPDLIILDIMMPKKSGVEVCEILRTQPVFHDTLILMLTALNDEGFHIKGLESGADDYVNKPVSPKVIVSRVGALLRRSNKESGEKTLKRGNLSIDPTKFEVLVDERQVTLAKKANARLYLLAVRAGSVFMRNEILHPVWGNDLIVADRAIDVHIRKLR